MDESTRLRLLEDAAAELLESETNGSLRVGVDGSDCDPLVLTAAGCCVLVTVGHYASVLLAMSSLRSDGTSGPSALAAGCERTLRTIHRLPDGFVPTLAFDNPANVNGFRRRLR